MEVHASVPESLGIQSKLPDIHIGRMRPLAKVNCESCFLKSWRRRQLLLEAVEWLEHTSKEEDLVSTLFSFRWLQLAFSTLLVSRVWAKLTKSSLHSWALHRRKYRINEVRDFFPGYVATSTGAIESSPYIYPISAYNSRIDLGAKL